MREKGVFGSVLVDRIVLLVLLIWVFKVVIRMGNMLGKHTLLIDCGTIWDGKSFDLSAGEQTLATYLIQTGIQIFWHLCGIMSSVFLEISRF